MSRLPAELQEEVFRRFFEAAEIAHFDRDKREKYISEMFTQDDYINEIETARENGEIKGRAEGEAKGRAEGLAEGKASVAASMIKEGLDMQLISKLTGFSLEELKNL